MSRLCIYRGVLAISGIFIIGYVTQLSLIQVSWRRSLAWTPVATPTRSGGWSTANVSRCSNCTHTRQKKFHVLINSYMNSGSRFTAQLFGFRQDAFYFYEPLWRFSVWDYFHHPDNVCSSLKGAGNCQKRSATQVNHVYQRRSAGSKLQLIPNVSKKMTVTDLMDDVLYHIYTCNFVKIKHMFVSGVTDHSQLAGEGWSRYRTCIRRKASVEFCLRQQEDLCRRAGHVVTKVLRLTTSSLHHLLATFPNLKVIQLFRDPRAIVNSRLESRGYPTNDVTLNSASLCHKMYLDYLGGVELEKKYPGRFRFIFYEDIKENVKDNMKKLYEFVGMDFNEHELERLNRVRTNVAISRTPETLKTRVTDNANWWRVHMTHARYQAVMNTCKQLVPIFNLTKFSDIHELNELSIPSLKLPDYMRI